MRLLLTLGFLLLSFICAFAAGSGSVAKKSKKAAASDDRGVAVVGKNSVGKRVALVIGNGSYRYTDSMPKLANPANDADDIAAALRRFDFEVIAKKNLTKEEMDETITDFGRKAANSDAALFYYAGHGLQVRGQNYLVPVDANIDSEAKVPYRAVNVNQLLEEMESSRSQVNIVMLDACRNNPISGKFRSGASRGLAPPAAMPKGTVIVYATDPGNVAADGSGRNGLFTAGLLKALKGNDLTLGGVLYAASKQVQDATSQQQTPYVNGPATVQREFSFVSPSTMTDLQPAPVQFQPVAQPVVQQATEAFAATGFNDPITGIEFVPVKGGCFRMGDITGDGDSDEKPVHEVCVDGFSMGKYTVTNAQYRKFKPEHNSGEHKVNSLNSDSQPVVNVSWDEAVEYAKWLSLKSGKNYRLPTEAEWEYAARGGTNTRNYWGDGKDDACGYANVHDLTSKRAFSDFRDNHNCSDGYAVTAPVGSFRPNGFGLYDMMGNVWQWTGDWYASDYYGKSPRNNPEGSSSGSARVIRGGGWGIVRSLVRASLRDSYVPGNRRISLGFRLVASVQ